MKRLGKRAVLTAVAGIAGGVGAAAPGLAITPGYASPLTITGGNWQSGICHHGQGACGNPDERWWANDLFDPSGNDPVFAMRPGFVRSSDGNGCGEVVRYNSSSAATATHGWLQCHGEVGSRKVNVGDWVSAGQQLMKEGATGTGTEHLHLEHRYMYGSSSNWSQTVDYLAYCVGAEVGRILANQSPEFVNAYRKSGGTTSTYNSNCTWS